MIFQSQAMSIVIVPFIAANTHMGLLAHRVGTSRFPRLSPASPYATGSAQELSACATPTNGTEKRLGNNVVGRRWSVTLGSS
jgi:hypothetical protein